MRTIGRHLLAPLGLGLVLTILAICFFKFVLLKILLGWQAAWEWEKFQGPILIFLGLGACWAAGECAILAYRSSKAPKKKEKEPEGIEKAKAEALREAEAIILLANNKKRGDSQKGS